MKLCLFLIFLGISYTSAFHHSRRNGNHCSSSRLPNPQSGCCGIDVTSTNLIIGGRKTLLKQYPWLALLEYYVSNSVQTLCGGFLISSRYVLSAAHCMETYIPRSVRLGEYDTSNNIQYADCVFTAHGKRECISATSVPIQNIIVHGGYSKLNQHRNDIALLRLTNMVPFTDHIRPICLPTSDTTKHNSRDHKLYAAGWGIVNQKLFHSAMGLIKQDQRDNTKRHVALPYVPDWNCKKTWNIWDKQICAGGDGHSTCNGDSGGPLMKQNAGVYEAVGIVSYGNPICNQSPAVFTKVFAYRRWIESNMYF